nr:hypothetical protein [Pectobacterium carotovorum]
MATGNLFTVAIMPYLGDLVAVPQVADIVLCLFTAFAGTSPERVIAVEPAFARRGVDNPELVTAVPAIVPTRRPPSTSRAAGLKRRGL